MSQIESLTSLRFFAAWAVFVFHYYNFSESSPLFFLMKYFKFGHFGVEFFFILSGFIMSLVYPAEKFITKSNFLKFYLFRAARILPVYYLSLFLALPILLKKLFSYSFAEGLLSVSSHLLVSQNLFPFESVHDSWNRPSWSLSVEIFFYLIYPLVIIFLTPLLKTTKQYAFYFLIVLLSGISFGLSSLPKTITIFGHLQGFLASATILYHLPVFFIGIFLGNIFRTKTFSQKSVHLLLICATLCFIPAFIYMASKQYESTLFFISYFSILIFVAAQSQMINWLLSNKWLMLLGEASYTFYIIQVPCKTYSQQLFTKVLHLGDSEGIFYVIFISLLTIAASLLIHLKFERPVRDYIKTKFSK